MVLDLILDTHAFVWLLRADERLLPPVRAMLLDSANTLHVSAVVAFEIATKVRIGKWPEAAAIDRDLVSILDKHDFVKLALSPEHGRLAGSFSSAHRDPFDRLLAAQAIIGAMPVVTIDSAIRELGAKTVWEPI